MKKLCALFLWLFLGCKSQDKPYMYFATVSDSEHYPWLKNTLISINKYNHEKVKEIALFDLGLTKYEREELEDFPNVKIYEVEKVNPFITKKLMVRPNGRLSRGWYSWKPVVIKQALDMFPYVLYMDAGIQVVQALDPIFKAIQKEGYYIIDCGHTIWPMATQYVRKNFNLETDNKWLLDELGILAGLQGVSRKVYDEYIMPMYNLAHDIKNFEDDGTAYWGFGGGRHDQILFSIYAHKLGYKIHKMWGSPSKLRIGDKKFYFESLRYFKLKKYKENPRTGPYKLEG